MIRIYDSNIGTTVILEGDIKERSVKLNHNEILSIRGNRFTESIRGVKDLDLTITYITEDDYKKLEDIFLLSNEKLEIDNIDTGKTYTSYYISGDNLSLDRHEDYENKVYYYKGGITLNKR